MLDRYDAIEGTLSPLEIRSVGELPERLRDTSRLQEKLKRDQQKLLSMVEYARCEGDRKAFFLEYFGIEA